MARDAPHALFYIDRTGCQWRAPPHDFPRWQTVYTCYRRWRLAGVWDRLHDQLRDQMRRHLRSRPAKALRLLIPKTRCA